MRMRRKPWARPELEACPFCIQDPAEHKGKWHDMFGNDNPIYMELGCGKGGFISLVASKHANINYLAIDVKSEVLVLAKRKIEAEYSILEMDINNVKIMSQNIEQIDSAFDENDKVDRIYINFCNPWPKDRHNKRRLTYPKQLQKYKIFLKHGGEIWFKTDDDGLFEESIPYLNETGFTIKYITRDLHNSGFEENVVTEHENMFTEMGIPTKFLIAVNN